MPVAIITGASEGLGRALALALAARGWDLVVDARHETPLRSTAEELVLHSGTVRAIPGDVADPDHRAVLVSAAEALGGTDLLVNNASTLGASPMPRLADVTDALLRRVLDVNVVAPLALVRLALPALRARGGKVVNLTSDAAVDAYPGWGGYGASKAALDHAGRILAAEEPEVRVYSVDPGDMRTRMHQDAFPGEDISDRPTPETVVPALLAVVTGDLPSGRVRLADVPGAEVPA